MWSGLYACAMHRHVRHLKPSISPIIEERQQTHAHHLKLAVNINKAVNYLFRNEHYYLHSSFGESVQFLQIHLVSWDALKETCQHDQPHCSPLFRLGSWDADLCSAPAPKPGDVWKQAWEVAGSEERRRDDALGCHVRTSCHVKCCLVRGVERPLIGYLPRSQPRPRLLWHVCNPIVGNKTKPRQCDIALKKKMSRFYLPLFYLIVFS